MASAGGSGPCWSWWSYSAEAVAVTAQGGYTITMSSFERFNGFTYEEPLMAIIDALPR